MGVALLVLGIVLVVIGVLWLFYNPGVDVSPEEAIRDNQGRVKHRQWWLASWWQSLGVERRIRTRELLDRDSDSILATQLKEVDVVNAQVALLTARNNLSETPAQIVHTNQMVERKRTYEIAAYDLNDRLLADAASRADGAVDVPTLMEMRKKQYQNQLDLEKDWQEKQNWIKAGIIYNNAAMQALAMKKELLFQMYKERKQLEASNDPAKDDQLMLLNESIAAHEAHFREELRLISAGNKEGLE
jgi:hypothetical protein